MNDNMVKVYSKIESSKNEDMETY
jgi:hypothetical protein